MRLATILLAALSTMVSVGSAAAQVAVGRITGSTSYAGAFSGYVAIFDIGSGRFAPVVSQLSRACRSAGNGQVSLLQTREFADSQHTLLAITANSGVGIPNSQDGECGVPSGAIIANGELVNPGETAGPVLYFTTPTHAAITDGPIPSAARTAVAGTTSVNNDCPDLHQAGTLLVRNGQPGRCPIPKATIAAGRGAAGLDRTGRFLIIATVEGSDGTGLRTRDFARLLIALGAASAVNFDGGGSTVFWWTPSAPLPSVSLPAAGMIARLRFPAGQPNPDSVRFSAALLPIGTPIQSDATHRAIYASLGLRFTGR